MALAQSTDATISGVVVDPTGKVIPGAGIEIVNDATGVHFSSETNGAGIYSVTILPPGEYRVQVSRAGFKTLIKPGIVLNVQSAIALNFTLPLGATSETITVEAGASAINTTDGSVSTVIDQAFVANMPLNGRSFQDLLTLSPGISQIPVNLFGGSLGGVGYSGEIVVNGQRTEANYFTVDGVSANTGVAANQVGGGAGFAGGVPGETVLGSTQSLVSVDALQEFRATTSTYSAEYGRTPGGQFSFTTRSGGNDFHGSVYDYLRNDALDASNWFNDYLDQPKGRERQNDFGGTLGGPVMLPRVSDSKHNTFFFLSYEGLRLDSPQAAMKIPVPDTDTRTNASPALMPVLNAFPIADGGPDGLNDGLDYFIQTVSYPAGLNNTAIRIDHHFGPKWNVFGRYAYTPSNTSAYNGAQENITTGSVSSLTLGSTNVLSSSQTNEIRFNFTRNQTAVNSSLTRLGGAIPFDISTIPGLGAGNAAFLFCLCYGQQAYITLNQFPSEQDQTNLTDTYNWQFRQHNVRAGVDWRRIETTLNAPSPTAEIYFESQDELFTNQAAQGLVEGQTRAKPVYLNFSAFVQDDWKVLSRLSLSMGLRWDVNPAPGNAAGLPPYTLNQVENLATAALAPAGTPLWKTDWHGFAPRFGLAYQVNPNPGRETVLRAGFGLFYDMGNVDGSAGFDGVGLTSDVVYTNVGFPFTPSQLQLPAPSVAPPYSANVWAFDPGLVLPYSLQYSAAIEQGLSKNTTFTVSYVGSGARKLLTQLGYFPGQIGNQNFGSYGFLTVTENRASSSYNSLQAKYQHNLSKGLQALFSYTWSHSIDDASANVLISKLLRGSSDFDVRHQFQAAVTFDEPALDLPRAGSALLNHWSADFRFQGRSSLPLDVGDYDDIVPSTGAEYQYQPDFVTGQPVYLFGPQYPGRKVLNYNAFVDAPLGIEGDVPRNYARAFDAVQADVAIRRSFPVRDKAKILFRGEAFNVLNHPQFGSVYTILSDGPGQFGYAYNTLNGQLGGLNPLFQVGGPRSLQMMLKIEF